MPQNMFGQIPKPQQGDPMEPKPGGFGGQGGAGGGGNPPMQGVPGFAQRKANAQNLYGPGGSGWAQNFAPTPQGPKQEQQPPQVRPMQPPPVFQAPPQGQAPQGPPLWGPKPFPGGPGVGQFGPPQGQGAVGQGAPPFVPPQPQGGGQMAALQQLFSQPGFMQLLQQYMAQTQQGPVKLPQGGGTGPYNPQKPQF